MRPESCTQDEERGTVLEIRHGIAYIRVNPTGECASCGLQEHCHDTEDKKPVLRWPAPKGLAVGQEVIVRKTATSQLKLTSLVYGLPLVTMTIGAYIGNGQTGDVGAIIGCAAGLVVGGAMVFAAGRFGTRKGVWTLSIEPAPDALQNTIEPV